MISMRFRRLSYLMAVFRDLRPRMQGMIPDLARGHKEAERATIRVRHGMKLGVHAAFRASDQAVEIPLYGWPAP